MTLILCHQVFSIFGPADIKCTVLQILHCLINVLLNVLHENLNPLYTVFPLVSSLIAMLPLLEQYCSVREHVVSKLVVVVSPSYTVNLSVHIIGGHCNVMTATSSNTFCKVNCFCHKNHYFYHFCVVNMLSMNILYHLVLS